MRKKFMMGTGAFALVIGGILATRGNKKNNMPARIFAGGGLNIVLFNCSATNHLTLIKGPGAVTCYFYTAYTGTLHTLFTSSSADPSKQIYYK